MNNNTIKFATIGSNFVVDWFLQGAAKCPLLKYKGTYSRNINRAKEFGSKYGSTLFFDDFNSLAKCDEIDAVYIASPNSEHFEQAKLMIENGKHVLIEKTIASNAREVQELIRLASKYEVVMMEAMCSAHNPGMKALEEAINEVGIVRRASFSYCKYSSRYDKFKSGTIENAFNPDYSNGALTDIGVYCVHPLVKLFGMPNDILAQAIILPESIDGEGTIIAKYDGMLAELLYSKISDNHIPSQIQGEKGTIIISDITNPREVTIIYRDGNSKTMDVVHSDNTLEFEAIEWAHMIENRDYSDKHSKYSLMSLKIMDEARRQQGIVFPADKKEWKEN